MIGLIFILFLGLGLLFLVLYSFFGFNLLVQLDLIFYTKSSIGKVLRGIVGLFFYITTALSFMGLYSIFKESGSKLGKYILSFFIDISLYQSTLLVIFIVASIITRLIAMKVVINLHRNRSLNIKSLLSYVLWIIMMLYAIAVTIVDFSTYIVMLFGGVLSIYLAVATINDSD